MKVIGFSAGTAGHEGNVDRMVKAIMDKSGYETEFVKLAELTYSACLGCVKLCAGPQVCRLEDDLFPYYQKLKEADAVVLGSPIRFGTISAAMYSFIERFFGYRHVRFVIQNKPFVLAVSGFRNVEALERTTDNFRKALRPFRVNILDVVQFLSDIPPCFSCGRHTECRIGGAYDRWGEEVHSWTITPEYFHQWEDNCETVAAIEAAAEKIKSVEKETGVEGLTVLDGCSKPA